MDLSFLGDFMVPVIVGICLCIGYIAKHWVEDMDNKYIPTMCAVVGVILAIWMSGWDVEPMTLLQGLMSGLAATGLHQAFAQFLEKK